MSPARKRALKSAKKTTKKVTRKAAAKKKPKAAARKKAAAKKTAPRKAAKKKTPKQEAKKDERKQPKKTAAVQVAKEDRKPRRQGTAQPLESAEKKPGLGAKWACFNCGAKFYDLNRPDPICPKCQTDQREQPAKAPVAAPSPPTRRPAAQPISRLLDDDEVSDAPFDDDRDAEAAAELDLGKLDDDVDYLDDADFSDDNDD